MAVCLLCFKLCLGLKIAKWQRACLESLFRGTHYQHLYNPLAFLGLSVTVRGPVVTPGPPVPVYGMYIASADILHISWLYFLAAGWYFASWKWGKSSNNEAIFVRGVPAFCLIALSPWWGSNNAYFLILHIFSINEKKKNAVNKYAQTKIY